jgi:phosphoserine aminotransferase
VGKIYFTVGPTELYPEVKEYLSEGIKNKIFSVPHRSEKFCNIIKETNSQIKKLLYIPNDFYIFYLSSATECMERIILNTVEKNSFHLINGYFAQRFYDIALMLKKKPEYFKAEFGKSFDFEKIKIPEKSEIICFVHNETSTGFTLDLNEIYTIKKNNKEKLIVVDFVTSVPYVKIDFKYIDIAFFSVQKGFGMPAGLGVLIVRKSCISKAKELTGKKISIGGFNNFIKLAENAEKNQTAFTPNMPGIYLLGKISEQLNKYGIEKLRKETDEKAKLIYDYFDTHREIFPFVMNKKNRSTTTIVLESDNAEKYYKKLFKNGFVVSKGYRDFKDRHLRIGNFPMHKIKDVKRMISSLS